MCNSVDGTNVKIMASKFLLIMENDETLKKPIVGGTLYMPLSRLHYRLQIRIG